MKNLKLIMCAGAASLGLSWAGAAAADDQPAATPPPPAATPATPPAPTAPPYPSMGPTLSNNVNSASFDAGPLGKLTVNGVLSGIALEQDHPGFNTWDGRPNKDFEGDASNAMVTVQKSDGVFQFVVQAGVYSFPTLGSGYIKSTDQPEATFGFAPVAYVKIAPNANWSFQAGQLPTLIGAELPFTYQNMNIERGLLWNTEPLFSRGFQANYTNGPWAASVAITDGFYSNNLTTLSGLLTYTFKNSDALTFAVSGNVSHNLKNLPFATPSALQQGQVYNLIFTHSMGKLTITPYLQFNNVPHVTFFTPSGTIWAGAVLAKYSFTSEISVAGRVEYESSSGAANLLYGSKSNAWSITITPTYQKGIFFARLEGSYTGVSGITRFECDSQVGTFCSGTGLGQDGLATSQIRGVFEAGVIF
jgi:hypothetical protein